MAEGLTGSLAQWPLPDILNMLCSSRQAGRIELTDGPNRADVYIRDGAIVHAASGVEVGEAVIATVMTWGRGGFSFEPRVATSQVTVIRPLADVLEEAQREVEERERIRAVIASSGVVARMALTIPGPVLVEPADWNLLALCDGQATIDDLTEVLRVDEWEITKQLYRLAGQNLVAFEEHAAQRPFVLPFVASPVAQAQAAAPTAPAEPSAPKPILTAAFFRELTSSAAQSLGPIATVVVDDGVDALGTTRDTFPREKATQLVEFVAGEISDDGQRVKFQQSMMTWIRQHATAA